MKLMRSKNISNICIQGKSNMELIAKNYLQFISCSFLMLIVIAFWKFPLSAPVLAIAFLLVSLMTAVWLIIKKYRKSYLEGKLTRGIFVRNVVIEIFGILLAMTLAGLLGRTIAQIATAQIVNELTKLIAGILIGLLAGVGIGILMTRTLGRILKT